jgi:hypothetical protein
MKKLFYLLLLVPSVLLAQEVALDPDDPQPPQPFQFVSPPIGSTFFIYSENQRFKFVWHKTNDPDSDPVTYRWILVGDVMTISTSADTSLIFTGSQFWTLLGIDLQRIIRWTVIATDSTCLSTASVDTFTLTIRKRGFLCRCAPLQSFHLLLPLNGATFYIDSSRQQFKTVWSRAYNPSGAPVTYKWLLIGTSTAIPTGMDTSLIFTGLELFNLLGSDFFRTIRWTVVATDIVGQSAAAIDTFTLTIWKPRHGDAVDSIQGIPMTYNLSQNFPNPFNPSTTIRYALPHESNVVLKVYDLLGREIQTLVEERQTAGFYEVTFEAKGLPSGMYLYKLSAASFVQVRRMLLLR